MAYQKISDLKKTIQQLADKAQSILELGEGMRYYNHSKFTTFNVKNSLESIKDILATLPIPTILCNKFEKEYNNCLRKDFLQQRCDSVKEWFKVDHEAAKTDEFEKAKKNALWNIDTDVVGFYGGGGGHFAYFKADEMEDIIGDCAYELKHSTKRDELLDFIERG